MYIYFVRQGETVSRVFGDSPPEIPEGAELLGFLDASVKTLVDSGIWKHLGEEVFDYGNFTLDEIRAVILNTRQEVEKALPRLKAIKRQLSCWTPIETVRDEWWEMDLLPKPVEKPNPNDVLTPAFRPLFALKG